MRISHIPLALGMCALCLASCMRLGPDFCSPDGRVACSWNNEMGAAVSSGSAEHCSWWEDFGDPVLNCLIQTAYDQNLSLQLACERMNEAQSELGIATGLMFPQVQRVFAKHVQGQLSQNIPPTSNLPASVQSGANRINDLFSMSFDVAWELDIWGRFRRGVESAQALYCAEAAGYDAVLVLVFSQVAESYVSYRMLEDLMSVAEENLRLQQRSLDIATVRFNNEISTELDVVQAQVLVQETRAMLPSLSEALIHAKTGLCLLLGMTSNELNCILADSRGVPKASAQVAVGLPAELLRRRPDIQQAEYLALSACARIGVAKTALFPHLALVGSIGYSSTNSGNLFSPSSLFWGHGSGIDWDILNYGRLTNAIHGEESRFRQAVLGYEKAVLQAQAEVENAFATLGSAQRRELAYTGAVKSAERALELALAQYKEGDADFTRVLDSQQALLAQQSELVRARAGLATGLVQLYKSLGGGWQWRLSDCMICEEEQSSPQENQYVR